MTHKYSSTPIAPAVLGDALTLLLLKQSDSSFTLPFICLSLSVAAAILQPALHAKAKRSTDALEFSIQSAMLTLFMINLLSIVNVLWGLKVQVAEVQADLGLLRLGKARWEGGTSRPPGWLALEGSCIIWAGAGVSHQACPSTASPLYV